MNKCLSCGEKLYGNVSMHQPCAKRVFDMDEIPILEISLDDIEMNPRKAMDKFSVSNVQTTVPLVFQRKERKLVTESKEYDYLLKLPVFTIPNLPQNQNLCLTIAERLEVPVPPHSLIPLPNNTPACIVKRYDSIDGQKCRVRTFDDILEKETIHSGSLEEIGEKIRKTSEVPGLDVQFFFEMVLLSFLIGHSDLHFKKFSLLIDEQKEARLAPLEDLVSTKLFRSDEEDFNTPMVGKTNGITGSDFKEFSRILHIPQKSYERIFLRFFRGKRIIGNRIKNSVLETDEQIKFTDIINDRFARLLQ